MQTVSPPSLGRKQIIFSSAVQIRLPAKAVRYYRHGWQSWSLAAWTGLERLPRQKPVSLHPMQIDPAHANDPRSSGSWLGAVEFEDGSVLLLGALGLDARVHLEGDALVGEAVGGEIEWFTAHGKELEVFTQYAAELGTRFGCSLPANPAPRVWCSWYSLYTDISEQQLDRIFTGLDGLPFDVLQVDDGWQIVVGDWAANARFPSGMQALAERIKRTGRRAGLWLAPLIAAKSSLLFRSHPGWFLRDEVGKFVSAGHNWGDPLYALDTTHPEVCAWLAALMQQVRAWGFDYLKLDFLYAGALPGKRFMEVPREAAYRQALQLLRSSMGADAFFLTCGTPILPALGLCDAMRIGPDVAGDWEVDRDARLLSNPTAPSTRNAIRTTLHRLWLKPLVLTDPDVAYFSRRSVRLNPREMIALQDLAHIAGFKATSDLPDSLTVEERSALLAFLCGSPQIEQTGRYRFTIDGREVVYSEAVKLPLAAAGLAALQAGVLGRLANWHSILRLNFILDRWKRRRQLKGESPDQHHRQAGL